MSLNFLPKLFSQTSLSLSIWEKGSRFDWFTRISWQIHPLNFISGGKITNQFSLFKLQDSRKQGNYIVKTYYAHQMAQHICQICIEIPREKEVANFFLMSSNMMEESRNIKNPILLIGLLKKIGFSVCQCINHGFG